MGFFVFFRLLTVIVFCLAAPIPSHGDGMGVMEESDLIVRYDEPLKKAAQEVVELYPRIKHQLESIFGWKTDFRPSIVLIKENARFQEIVVNPHIMAFAVPAQDLIVIDHSKMNVNPFTLEVTLKHEMCHLLLGRRIPDERLPRWLNEGFCQWVTGGVTELMIDGRQPSLSKASLSRRLIPLASLGTRFPEDKSDLILAYEESKSVLDYMVAEHGRDGVVAVFEYLRTGNTVDEAFKKALSVTLDEFEREWIQDLRGKITWLGYMAANIYTIILFVAALLTVCGFLRLVIRRRLKAPETDESD